MSWIIQQINNNQYLFFYRRQSFDLSSCRNSMLKDSIELNWMALRIKEARNNWMAPIIWQKLAGDFSIGSHCLSLKAKRNGGGIEKQKKKEEEEGGGGGGGGITVPEANVALNQTENNSIRIFHSFGVDVSFNLPSQRPKIDKNQMLPTTINIPRRFQQQQQQQLPHKVSIKPARKPTAICNLMNDKWRQNATE